MQGKFICFCGLDGAGKTTQAVYLKKYFEQNRKMCQIIHGFKPGKHNKVLKEYAAKNGDNFSKVYTDTIKSISYLCDIYETYYQQIRIALENGSNVICDKYVVDSVISAPLLGANKQLIEDFAKIIPEPDVYICMQIAPEVAYARIIERGGNSGSRKNNLEFMQKTSQIYQKIERKYPNVVCVNGENNIDAINQEILEALFAKNIIE